mmetsp:Transcript_1596/g.1763  ORF Transcript_1596/g.1763 Transcript_1596/m.1763 type:complete len:1121 (+) Transcript_1596:109-3471(+)
MNRLFKCIHDGIPNLLRREFSYLTSSSTSTSCFHQHFQRNNNAIGINRQQLRFRRHDRASAFSKPRPPTKKKRREYNRKMKAKADEEARKSPPGSKAGPRREWAQNRWQQLLTYGTRDANNLLPAAQEREEYSYEDAILEDLIGNTSYLTSQPTPEPAYLGHRHREFYNRVADQMDAYRGQNSGKYNEEDSTSLELIVPLPSDKDISNTLRAHRDRHGTRQKPIGIVKGLQHLLQDLETPTTAFGEYTFTTLMTCCRTPQEGRRIFKLMRDHNHEISSYSWSILVDIHAKLGDFEGCGEVLKEMASDGGHAPTQAAYTSLLAACYKICQNSGRIPHAVRAKAWDFGWRYWQELRIVGIEPDVMAYGAILRLCAVRGQPERAIGLLEDMERFEVKPTTLCFTAALRAVARSHETAIRYERGWSRINMKRENTAAHHGKMARQVVIMSEAAEVEHDDGFISALMLCTAAAGDSATTKAVLLASEIRKMDHLRTIGGSRVDTLENHDDDLHVSNEREELESGKMTKTMTPIIDVNDTSYSSGVIAIEDKSKRLSHNNKDIPTFTEREYGKDTRVISALIHSCAQAMNKNGIGTMWAGRENLGFLCENSLRLITTRWEPSYRDTSIPGISSTKIGIGSLRRIDEKEKDEETRPGKRKKFRGLYIDEDDLDTLDDIEEGDDPTDYNCGENDTLVGEDDLFSHDDEPLQNMLEYQTSDQNDTEQHTLTEEQIKQYTKSEVFEKFLSELKDEAAKNGEEFDLSEDEAREMFDLMEDEFWESGGDEGANRLSTSDSYDQFLAELKEQAEENDEKFDLNDVQVQERFVMMQKDQAIDSDENKFDITSYDEGRGRHFTSNKIDQLILREDQTSKTILSDIDPGQLTKIRELQSALPGMPIRRLKKILDAYEETLGHTSMLKLVPILRETMPDTLSSGWLKRNNNKNAEFALLKASDEGIVDSALLNSMLEVKANSGSLNGAVEYHANQFTKHKLTPSTYSDRLVLQMLVANKRLTRALEFKENIEKEGRYLDIASYGSLIQCYSRHDQIGSAVLFLKECSAKHGAVPSEAYLSKLRSLCRKKQVEIAVDLIDILGNDPNEWLRHGQKNLKREYSKKGRRNINIAKNRLLS